MYNVFVLLTNQASMAQGTWYPRGAYSEFQVTGMIEGHFGFEIFDSGMFLGTKI